MLILLLPGEVGSDSDVGGRSSEVGVLILVVKTYESWALVLTFASSLTVWSTEPNHILFTDIDLYLIPVAAPKY